MRKGNICLLLVVMIAIAIVQTQAQTASTEEGGCDLTTEEIMSAIKAFSDVSPIPDAVLIAGEVSSGTRYIRNPIKLMEAIAYAGGMTNDANREIYVIRQSAENRAAVKLKIDYKAILVGQIKNIALEKGDIVFVPRACHDGKQVPLNRYLYPGINPRLISIY